MYNDYYLQSIDNKLNSLNNIISNQNTLITNQNTIIQNQAVLINGLEYGFNQVLICFIWCLIFILAILFYNFYHRIFRHK